ncbi:amino acid ABC transporter ATP-binding protein [Candidatus Trichorickettsia mobilis]|uniref:amino acid ABC transporter ATP-binding protein n=1 Tax=Candidatus Trichorickettsia mobilis TaxID=1346319 RepID=UPI00292F5D20|nr:ATP-binding cassette domain-containing protein [Candidatus Trichorickettsia mobilis]
MLSINNVCKRYGTSLVLNNINLNIETNSIVGIAGPSGGGKSTLLRCIQKLEELDSGEIIFTGKSGFMFQDFQLFPHMTILENLVYAPNIHHRESLVNHNNNAIKLLQNLGIVDKAECFPHQLSGGQKQRVALARSLMMQPEILLCDEPTSGLDVATIIDVVSLLSSIRDMKVTMIIASHDLDFITRIADRVVLLKNATVATDVRLQDLENPIQYLKAFY